MKKYLTRCLALVVTLCLCLSLVPMALAAPIADPPEPGPIDMSVKVTELANRNYRVVYTAKMSIIKELATVAVSFRDHELMSDLRFTCILEDELVSQLTSVGKDDFVFDCAQWNGVNIFVFESASVTDDGLELRYKLHSDVVDDWADIETKPADIMAALTERMTMTASGTVSRATMNSLPKQVLTTGEVTLEGIGVQKVYGTYNITGAEGSCRWLTDDYSGSGIIRPGYGKDHDHACVLQDCPRNIHCPAGHFVDLDLQLWYHDGIHFCAAHDLMIGMTGTTFEPYTAINRAMVVTILYRMEGEPAVTGRYVYDDVVLGSWYSDAVEWATDNGVVNGYGGGKFGPMDPITREQMAAILWRYAKYQGCDVSETTDIDNFYDAEDVSNYAVPAMQWACGTKMIQGAGGYLMPLDSTTRAQAAAIIQRYCMYVGW